MAEASLIRKSLLRSSVYTLLLTLAFLAITWQEQPLADILMTLPYFIVLYFLLFTIGKPEVSEVIRIRANENIRLWFLFPLALVVLYFSYVGFNYQNPFKGELFLVPYLLFFPVLAFSGKKSTNRQIDWFDFVVFFLFVLPVTLINVKPSGNLPFHSGGFDSVYRISVMLVAVFAFVTVRGIKDVGFYPQFSWRKLFTVLWVWGIFYGFVFIIGYAIDFISFKNGEAFHVQMNTKVFWSLLTVFLHTALFEELVFRGLLQRMLTKRIEQGGNWKIFLFWGTIVLIVMASMIGFSLNGPMQWFPALVTILLCLAAFGLEKQKGSKMGSYTALALTSIFFGLVHAHTGSNVFVGLAAIGGWAYGYTYLKTGNVFYAALLHALVNTTPLMFGLELAK